MAEIKLQIEGMHCGACVRRVTQALTAVEGAVIGEVTIGAARLTFSQSPAPVDLAVAALAKAGFAAHQQA